ncbi:unnamed protein product [Gongylonema pulchrum]|uniref:Uncharacterized protein n=1 Tax=Gongylonema pulchrum TaxID=637853 RepID=A0A3P7NJ42_9BILA|nr:unnamed protein product [Gongylonema pulchrum]
MNLPRNCFIIQHCYISAKELPPTEFYGYGFGLTVQKAVCAASKEFVERISEYAKDKRRKNAQKVEPRNGVFCEKFPKNARST